MGDGAIKRTSGQTDDSSNKQDEDPYGELNRSYYQPSNRLHRGVGSLYLGSETGKLFRNDGSTTWNASGNVKLTDSKVFDGNSMDNALGYNKQLEKLFISDEALRDQFLRHPSFGFDPSNPNMVNSSLRLRRIKEFVQQVLSHAPVSEMELTLQWSELRRKLEQALAAKNTNSNLQVCAVRPNPDRNDNRLDIYEIIPDYSGILVQAPPPPWK